MPVDADSIDHPRIACWNGVYYVDVHPRSGLDLYRGQRQAVDQNQGRGVAAFVKCSDGDNEVESCPAWYDGVPCELSLLINDQGSTARSPGPLATGTMLFGI